MAAVAPGSVLHVKPPLFRSVPRLIPGKALLCSGLWHVLVLAVIWLISLFPPSPRVVFRNPAYEPLPEYRPLDLGDLPSLEEAGGGDSGGGSEGRSRISVPARQASSHSGAGAAQQRAGVTPKTVFSGSQDIASHFPEATNNVQTIRRPDLIVPPKLKFPVKLQSMVVLPPPTLMMPVAPPANTAAPPDVALTSAPPREEPQLPVRTVRPLAARVDPVAAPMLRAKSASAPDLSVKAVLPVLAQPAPAPVQKAAVVLNAVNVPADPLPSIPDAEILGNFTASRARNIQTNLTPSSYGAGVGAGGGTASKPSFEDAAGNDSAGSGNGSGGGSSLGRGPGGGAAGNGGNGTGEGGAATGTGNGRGAGTGSGIGIGKGGPGSGRGTGSGNGTGIGSGGGTGTGAGSMHGPGTGNGGLPGITISGGRGPARAGGVSVTRPVPRGSYSLTIISGGSNGGASRDLGVFGRGETVYNVYIPMGDIGGGPDWSMEYAIAGTPASSNGLLAPPIARKKVRATIDPRRAKTSGAPVFVAGIIDETGKVRDLRAFEAQEPLCQAAMTALQQWEFSPAEMDGKPVPTKILIGVTVIAAPESAAAQAQ